VHIFKGLREPLNVLLENDEIYCMYYDLSFGVGAGEVRVVSGD